MQASQKLPVWFTPEHQKRILELYRESGGRCVFTHKTCAGNWDIKARTVTNCRWLMRKPKGMGAGPEYAPCVHLGGPMAPGEECFMVNPSNVEQVEAGKKTSVPCETITIAQSQWHCAYGRWKAECPIDHLMFQSYEELSRHYQMVHPSQTVPLFERVKAWDGPPCYSAVTIPDDVFPGRVVVIGELIYAFPEDFKEMLPGVRTTDYLKILAKDWRQLHADLKRAEQLQEERVMHAGTPATERQLGRFSDIAREIFHEEQPGFYIKGLSIMPAEGGKWKPVANVEIPSSSTYDQEKKKWVPQTIIVDITSAMKNVSKAARNKAIRYGKPLPGPAQLDIEMLVGKAVRERLK